MYICWYTFKCRVRIGFLFCTLSSYLLHKSAGRGAYLWLCLATIYKQINAQAFYADQQYDYYILMIHTYTHRWVNSKRALPLTCINLYVIKFVCVCMCIVRRMRIRSNFNNLPRIYAFTPAPSLRAATTC